MHTATSSAMGCICKCLSYPHIDGAWLSTGRQSSTSSRFKVTNSTLVCLTGRKSRYSSRNSYVFLVLPSGSTLHAIYHAASLPSPWLQTSNWHFDIHSATLSLSIFWLAITVGILVLLLALFFIRRRRLVRHQQQAALANNQLRPTNQGGMYYPSQNNVGNTAYGYAPQQSYGAPPPPVAGQQYYEQQSQTYNYGPSAETWQAPPPKYEPPPPDSQNITKGAEGQATMNNSNSTPAMYPQPDGPPPPANAQPQPGNDNRV